VGIPIFLFVAWAFSARLPVCQRLDNAILDKISFRYRNRIRESEAILNVDVDDATLRQLSYPIGRHLQAQVISALDRFGAKLIVFDVEFKADIRRTGGYRPDDGDFVLDDKEAALHAAIARSGRVILGYHLDFDEPLSIPRTVFERLKSELSEDFSLDRGELARRSGIPVTMFESEFENLRERAALEIAREQLHRNATLAFAPFAAALLPKASGKGDPSDTRVLQYAYWMARTRALLDSRVPEMRVEGLPAASREGRSLVTPLFPFFEKSRGVGLVNAEYDTDGVLRRPPAYLLWERKPYPYLGLAAGATALVEPGETSRIRVRPTEILVDACPAGEGPPRRSVRIPLDDEGRILVNWAGNESSRRDWFSHIPFVQAVSAYEDRYVFLDTNFRNLIVKTAEDTGEPYHPEYLKLSDHLQDALAGRQVLSPQEFQSLESKLDAIREAILKEQAEEVAGINAQLPKLAGKEMLLRRTREARDRIQAQMNALRAPYDREKEIRRLVEGKICLIGAAHSGSGDLHSTPLGPGTPGVDVHANVANMVLTGQTIRRGPPWVDFAYLSVVGLLVSLAVVHWKTGASLLVSAVVVGAAFAGYWALFTKPVILISGSGPLLSAGLTYLGVVIFKELVTQRSKRKLQRELERSTSPEMVKILLEHPEFLSKPRSMTGTFLFTDVAGFTSISEKMTPDVLFPFINRMLDTIAQALKAHQAYIDKYVGDGVVALFGMPVSSPDHAKNACLAALECQVRLKALNEEFLREGLPPIRVRIGVNSGDTKSGMMGAVDRSSYTAMGDPINLASRLEGANKSYNTYIMIGEQTLELVRGQFIVRELDRIRVVGKKLPVSVFELIAPAGALVPFPQGFLEGYGRAMKLFQGRQWGEALEAFQALLRIKPGDKPCENYVERAGEFLAHPPPADQEIVFELHSK
jgi:class 3 adenylate cyclase/CHASE2 domain-containing sensor protein